MKIKLEEPILIQIDSESTFMIAEYIEINHITTNHQISYYGRVYNYDKPEIKQLKDGQWIYDLNLNMMLSKDENGNYD